MNRFFSLYNALVLLISWSHTTHGLSYTPPKKTHTHHSNPSSRRVLLTTITNVILIPSLLPTWMPANAHAAAAATATAVDAQFINVGQQEPPPEGESPFVTLSGGVQIKDFRMGSGEQVVQTGSRVELTVKGRLLNLNGVIFYDTKSNDPNGFGEGTPLLFTVGDGTVLPGLERGILGMKRGGIRRIIVPSKNVGYGTFPSLEPQPLTEMERRALDSVVKNSRRDATVLFDVKVERVR